MPNLELLEMLVYVERQWSLFCFFVDLVIGSVTNTNRSERP